MSPSPSSALVTVAEDAELRLVRLLAESGSTSPNFVQVCENCIGNGDAAQLMRTVLAEQGAITALLSLEGEAVSAVSLLAALLNRVKKEESCQLVEELANSIIRTTPTDATDVSRSISLLATLYNMRSDPSEKVNLLVKMIRFAASRQASLLEPNTSVLGKWMDASKLSSMLDEWGVDSRARRPLYLAAAESAATSQAKQQFTLLVVQTYTASDLDSAAMESSQKAAIGAIKDPVSLFVQQRNILSLPAIQALEKNSAPLFALLKVFQEGKLGDYHSFLKSNGGEAVLAKWNLSPDECVRYMRILSLCSLAAEHEEIPYQVVADTLQTAASDVEKWVIAAVSSGLLSAKMDQLQQKVIVERCVVRRFDMDQWKALQSRLHLWKQNVGGILDAYKQSLQQQQ